MMGKSLCKWITSICFFVIKRTNEQPVNGLSKIAWASVFRLMSRCLYVCISVCLNVCMSPCLHGTMVPCLHVSTSPSPCLPVFMSVFPQMENVTNGNSSNFCLFFLQTENFRLSLNGNEKTADDKRYHNQ